MGQFLCVCLGQFLCVGTPVRPQCTGPGTCIRSPRDASSFEGKVRFRKMDSSKSFKESTTPPSQRLRGGWSRFFSVPAGRCDSRGCFSRDDDSMDGGVADGGCRRVAHWVWARWRRVFVAEYDGGGAFPEGGKEFEPVEFDVDGGAAARVPNALGALPLGQADLGPVAGVDDARAAHVLVWVARGVETFRVFLCVPSVSSLGDLQRGERARTS